MHEAGHVAACISLRLQFREVNLRPPRKYTGIVEGIARQVDEAMSTGVFTPELERQSTSLVIMSFAGPVCDALSAGRKSFEINRYDDLNPVLDIIENRFANNSVRMAFTHYCEAEAFALFEEDTRLWRFTQQLAKELEQKKKMTYEQCLEFYNQEYFVESWVRKEE
jgi:hypothetical protein